MYYSIPDKEALKKEFVGKSLKDVPTPAAVLDLSKMKANCQKMLDATQKLGFGWRAHIKTHKTTELTRLQVGDSGPVNLIVSTILEAEKVVPLLLEYRTAGRDINLLYSFPLPPSSVPRLSALNKTLGNHALNLMIDHVSQLSSIDEIYANTSIPPSVFIKIDMGGSRAGVRPQTEACSSLISGVLAREIEGKVKLLGLYAHAGHSYSSSNPGTALDFLRQELEALLVTAEAVHSASPEKHLVLSVGATPTTTSVQNLLAPASSPKLSSAEMEISALKATIDLIRAQNSTIEIHAGVYPTLDLQQLATHALPDSGTDATLSWGDLALTVLAEVASLYPGRGNDGTDEALIAAGSLALGREPCKAYSGWGILTPYNRPVAHLPTEPVESYTGWRVGRISQEHGILTSSGGVGCETLEVGQKVRIWPNHACIAGAGFGWYLIVDSSREGREDEVIDVWVRWRGW